jgi:1-deoxy-D-xylulose-5-phosphate reductoisomerase
LNLEAVVSLDDLEAVFTVDARARELAGQWLRRHGR